MEWKRCSVFEFSDSDGKKAFIWKLTSEAFINNIKNHTHKVEEILRVIPTNLQVLSKMKFHLWWKLRSSPNQELVSSSVFYSIWNNYLTSIRESVWWSNTCSAIDNERLLSPQPQRKCESPLVSWMCTWNS